MKAETVVETIKLLQTHGIDVVVDGGWGVDALLGRQTRLHDDLDIAIRHEDVPKLRELLGERGFAQICRDDTRDCNFVLEDKLKNQVDVHSYVFDERGNNIYGVAYLPEHLTGEGVINGYRVKCVPPESAVEFHTGYLLDENDFHDVRALCDEFNIKLPHEYEKFLHKED